jgi:hypothetical protein
MFSLQNLWTSEWFAFVLSRRYSYSIHFTQHVYQSIEGVSAHGCLVQFNLQVSSLPYHIFVRPYELCEGGTTTSSWPLHR